MKSLARPNSQTSRSELPPLVFNIEPSRRIRVLACALFLFLVGSVLSAPRPALFTRVLIALGISALAAGPLLKLGFRGERFNLQDAVLLNESTVLGPWVFLVWSHEGRRHYRIIDSLSVDPVIFRKLRSRLARPARLRGVL